MLTSWSLSKSLYASPLVCQFPGPGRIIGCHERLSFRWLGKDLRTLIVFGARRIAHSIVKLCRCGLFAQSHETAIDNSLLLCTLTLSPSCRLVILSSRFCLMFDCIACVFSGVANLAVKNIAAFGFRDVLLFFPVFVFVFVFIVAVAYWRSIYDTMMTSVFDMVGWGVIVYRHCQTQFANLSTMHSQQQECTPDSQECTLDSEPAKRDTH